MKVNAQIRKQIKDDHLHNHGLMLVGLATGN